MATSKSRINEKIREILINHPQGIRYSELIEDLHKILPDIPINTLHGTLFKLRQDVQTGRITDIVQPDKGIYIISKYPEKQEPSKKTVIKEEDFYQPFVEYLMSELEECTKAIPLGRNKFADKWGTPDVFGVYKFSEADAIKPPIEIITSEIKTDSNQLITAFGQACAYKLFSHKVYLVIPKDAEQDISRIESLCQKFGIGLILFNKNNPEIPQFEIRTRAVKGEPDYFYVNKYLRLLGDDVRTLL